MYLGRRMIMEEKIKVDKMCVATLVQENEIAEADAVIKYNRFLEVLAESDISKSKKEIIESVIYEIIGDELNHQDRLKSLYTLITGIKEAKD